MRYGSLRLILSLFLSLTTILVLFACGGGSSSDSSTDSADEPTTTTLRPWIDTHAHPRGYETDCTSESCIAAALAVMAEYGVEKTIFMHPPAPAAGANPESETEIRAVVAQDPERLFYGAGGNTLNSLIQRTLDDGTAPQQLQDDFAAALAEIQAAGDFVSFGETAVLHVSYSPLHAFEETRADTPLFYALADYAAAANVPIDLHMDVVSAEMTTPAFYTNLSVNNPSTLSENVSGLENLLAYNREARIVLAHVGRDTTGQLTAALIDQLLADHGNLYIQIHPVFGPLHTVNSMVDANGTIRSQWLTVLEKYPTRAVVGSDNFFAGGSDDGTGLGYVQDFLQQLPADLATAIGCTNPVTIYNLPSGCD